MHNSPANPSNSANSSLFYGWWNVGSSFIGLSLSYAMFTVFAFGVFLKPLADEFGWQRYEMAKAYSITNLTLVVAAPLLGILIDRFGVRRVLLPSVILMGLAVASMSQLTANIYHFYAMYLLIPLLGAGTLPTSYSRTIIAWFFHKRGIALGITLAGFGIGAALIPPIGQMLITDYGWRNAYLIFAAMIFLISFPVTYCFLRETPEEMGLEMDGGKHHEGVEQAQNGNVGLSLKKSAGTGSFWLILGAFLLVGTGVSSLIAHMVPMLTDRGLDPQLAAYCQMTMGLGLIVGRVLSGYLMDRFFAPYVAASFTLMFVFGAVILASGSSGYLVFVAAVFIGLSLGSEIAETAYLVSRYFGPKAYGMIYGIMFGAFQLGSSIGPPALGKYFQINGDYQGALWVLAGLGLIGALLVAILKPYPNLQANNEVPDNKK